MGRKIHKKSGAKRARTGAPSGLVISLAFHGVVFFLAGIFVVFHVLPEKEPVFEPPPPIERPKMKLKKPKVKVQKSSTPKPSSRIVAKVKTAKMPEIQIPDLMGTGEGLLGGTGLGGEFIDLPDVGEINIIGKEVSAGNDMEVTFYTMAKRKNGEPGSMLSEGAPEFFDILRDFVKSGWKKSKLHKLYKSPKKLYATSLMIPITSSVLGPAAFNEDINYGYAWIALYEGKLVYKEDIKFRFWGASDDILTVAVDNEVVLAANFSWEGVKAYTIADFWTSHAVNNRTYVAANQTLVGGDWIELKAGVPRDFKAITGEGPGGEYFAYLLVEVEGEHYPLNEFGGRIFPMFCTEKPTWELQDVILENLFEDEANVMDVSPIFQDF